MILAIFAIGLGGFIGANLRYWFSSWVANQTTDSHFPYGTFLVNMIGCFGLALFATLANERLKLSEEWKLFVATGFFGAFTTFSTFSLENYTLFTDGHFSQGFLNAFGSLLIGLMSTVFGVWVARLF